ncbi:MAG: DUF6049 family protein [Acidimicrobiia bacterium]
MTRAARVAAIAAALLASSLATAVDASAPRASTAAAPGDRIELVSQDAWTPAGGDLRVGVRISGPIAADATLRLVASPALSSRSEFDRVIANEPRSPVLDEVQIPLAPLSADANGTYLVSIGLESSGVRDPVRLGLQRAGVYPLRVELTGIGEDRSSTFTTFAVVTEATPDGQARQLASRLGVAWVWPLQAGPSMLPNGSLDPIVLDSFDATGRLGQQAAALARAGDIGLTLVPGPETLEAWVAHGRDDPGAARGAAAVIDAATRGEVLSTAYAPTNLPSLLAAGLDPLVDRQLAEGRKVLTAVLESPPVTTTALARPADEPSLTRLRAQGVAQVIVDSDALVPSDDGESTITRPFQIRSGPDSQERLTAVASDSGLVSLIPGDDSTALRAQRVLAGLSIVAQEAPSAPRAVVLASQSELAVDGTLFDALFAGLRGHPWLETMTIADIFARVPSTEARSDAVRTLAPAPVPEPPVPAVAWLATQARLDAFAAAVGPDDPIVTEATQALLIAQSSTFIGADGVARAAATLAHVNGTIDEFLSGIRVPDPGTITLTSRAGEIPLTFRNDTGRNVRITVTLASPKLFFPEGATYNIELAPRSTTLPVAVRARTSGTFPLQLSVRTFEGDLAIAETRFQVRSTVVSTVGLTLMISAAVFLAAWWGLYIRRARRRRRESVAQHG